MLASDGAVRWLDPSAVPQRPEEFDLARAPALVEEQLQRAVEGSPLTRDHSVTYTSRRGPHLQGARRSDSPKPARRTLRARRADAERARGSAADDPFRGDEALEGARRGEFGRQQTTRPGEAALPEPGPNSPGVRALGQQVRRAVGRDP